MRRLAVVTAYGRVLDRRPIATFALDDTSSVDLEVVPADAADAPADAAMLAVQARWGRTAIVEQTGDTLRFVGWWEP